MHMNAYGCCGCILRLHLDPRPDLFLLPGPHFVPVPDLVPGPIGYCGPVTAVYRGLANLASLSHGFARHFVV